MTSAVLCAASSLIAPRTFVAITTLSRGVSASALAEDRLALAARVHVGGIEKVDAGVERAVDEGVGLVLADLADAVEAGPEGHRAEAEFGDFEAGAAERAVVHGGGGASGEGEPRERFAAALPSRAATPRVPPTPPYDPICANIPTIPARIIATAMAARNRLATFATAFEKPAPNRASRRGPKAKAA